MLTKIKRAMIVSGVIPALVSGIGIFSSCTPAQAQSVAGGFDVAPAKTKRNNASPSASSVPTVVSKNAVSFGLAVRRTMPTETRVLWNGKLSYLMGVNYAWWNYGTDFGTGGWGKFTDWTNINSHFAAMNFQGVRVVRWLVFADCRYSPEFNANGNVSGLDASVMTDLDHALQIAADNNVYLMLNVLDGSAWSGGWDDGYVQSGGHAAMVTDPAVQQSFLDNALKPLLQHVAASPYAKRVMAYDIVNEPESNIAGYWGGTNLPASSVQTFVRRAASYIHQYGGGAYATVGSATPYYTGTWKNLGLDFYQVHYYPWMDFGNGAGSGLPTAASLNLDKPVIVGEYATADASYGQNDTAPLSAKWYLDSIYNKGYAGGFAWSLFVSDSATNWGAFQPVFTPWAQSHAKFIGP